MTAYNSDPSLPQQPPPPVSRNVQVLPLSPGHAAGNGHCHSMDHSCKEEEADEVESMKLCQVQKTAMTSLLVEYSAFRLVVTDTCNLYVMHGVVFLVKTLHFDNRE